jgi:lipid II:glycine glycyltransferase (peptidoglycan interpeptide bridge formation enzyme)
MNNSVYQTKEYLESDSKEKIIEVSKGYYAIERTIKTPMGAKRILEAKGTPNRVDLRLFKKRAKNYFYGTIAGTVVSKNKEFEEENYYKIVNNTILIDLAKTEEELWKNLEKKSARWGVKTAEKNGLKVEIGKNEEIDEFYKIYAKISKESNFKRESKHKIRKIITTNIGELYVIKNGVKVIGGGLILYDIENKYSILDLTGINKEGMKLQAMPLLYWKFIVLSKMKGMEYFDLGGYDSNAKNGSKLYNVNKFKERFGGEIVEQPIYSTNCKYPFIRSLMRWFGFLRKLYRKD